MEFSTDQQMGVSDWFHFAPFPQILLPGNTICTWPDEQPMGGVSSKVNMSGCFKITSSITPQLVSLRPSACGYPSTSNTQ